jgi:phage recombination protein Bet
MGSELTTTTKQVGLIAKVAGRYSIEPDKFASIIKQTAFRTKDRQPSNEELAALLAVAERYGLDVWTKQIHAFVDKSGGIVPVVGVDGWNHLEQTHPQFAGERVEMPPREEWIQIDEDAKLCPPWIMVTIKRSDHGEQSVTEYLDECYKPAYEGSGRNGKYKIQGPWQTHTKRMLRHKARIQAIREVLSYGGIYDEDEAERIVEASYDVEVTATEVDEIGEEGWRALVSIAEGYGYEEAERLLLGNAEALGYAGPGERMPRETAARLRAAMDASCGGDDGPDDEPDAAEVPSEGSEWAEAAPEPQEVAEEQEQPESRDDQIPGMDGEQYRRACRDEGAEQAAKSPSKMARDLEAKARDKEGAAPRRKGTVTAPQLTRICAQCGELERLGVGVGEWRVWMAEGWNVAHRDELSKTAASQVIDGLQGWINRIRQGAEAGAA